MIKEAYCSFEVAKILKEKGFDELCNHYYLYKKLKKVSYYERNSDVEYPKEAEYCTAPTYQMAMAWLREVHNIYANPIKQGNYNDCSEYYTWIVARMGVIYRNSSVADKLNYEEAVEAALKYALENLI